MDVLWTGLGIGGAVFLVLAGFALLEWASNKKSPDESGDNE